MNLNMKKSRLKGAVMSIPLMLYTASGTVYAQTEEDVFAQAMQPSVTENVPLIAGMILMGVIVAAGAVVLIVFRKKL